MKLKIENEELIGYEREKETIIIPYGVTRIGNLAFNYCVNITSIIIPDSVTSIGYKAFRNCISLTSITIPNSVENIGDWAFYGCYDPVVHCKKGSYAEEYCIENGIDYEVME